MKNVTMAFLELDKIKLDRMIKNKECPDCGKELTKEYTLSEHIFWNSIDSSDIKEVK